MPDPNPLAHRFYLAELERARAPARRPLRAGPAAIEAARRILRALTGRQPRRA